MFNRLKKCAENQKLYNDLLKYIQWSVYFDENIISKFSSDIVDIL